MTEATRARLPATAVRLLRHLVHDFWSVRRRFPAGALAHIERVIAEEETRHEGELRFAVEATLPISDLVRGMTSRDRALAVFATLGVWDTEQNSGVLVYLLLADRRVEIVADRGITRRVPQQEWDGICRDMETRFAAKRFEEGVVDGLRAIGALLARHFPHIGDKPSDNPNELPDRPIVL